MVTLVLEDKGYRRNLQQAEKALDTHAQSVKQADRALDNAGDSAARFGKDAERAHDRAARAAKQNASETGLLAGAYGKLRGAVAAFLTFEAAKAFGRASAAAFQTAAAVRETEDAFSRVLGSAAPRVREFVGEWSTAAGQTESESKRIITAFGGIGAGAGLAGEDLAEFTEGTFMAAADLQSFFNLAGDDSFQRLRSALTGSSEVVDQFGINLREAALEEFALSQGIRESTRTMSEREKILLRLQKIQADMGRMGAGGNLAATMDSDANRVRALAAAFRDAAEAGSVKLLPTFAMLADEVEDFFGTLNGSVLADRFGRWVFEQVANLRRLWRGVRDVFAAFGEFQNVLRAGRPVQEAATDAAREQEFGMYAVADAISAGAKAWAMFLARIYRVRQGVHSAMASMVRAVASGVRAIAEALSGISFGGLTGDLGFSTPFGRVDLPDLGGLRSLEEGINGLGESAGRAADRADGLAMSLEGTSDRFADSASAYEAEARRIDANTEARERNRLALEAQIAARRAGLDADTTPALFPDAPAVAPPEADSEGRSGRGAQAEADRALTLREKVNAALAALDMEQAAFLNALAQERLRQQRASLEAQLREEEAFAVDSVGFAAQKLAALRQMDLERTRLALEGLKIREAADLAAQRAEQAAEEGRTRRSITDADAEAQALAAVRRQGEADRLRITQEAELERERIETETRDARIAREQDYTAAVREQARERQRIHDAIADMDPPDVGATVLAGDPAIKAYTEGLREAEARLAAGITTQKEFNAEVEALRKPAGTAMKALIQRLLETGLVTEETADKIRELKGELESPDVSAWEKLADVLYDIADVLAETARLADALGNTDLSSLASDYADMVAASGDFAASAASGDGAGMVRAAVAYTTATVDLIRGISARREQEERSMALLRQQTRATDRNTEAILRSGQVGEEVSREMLAGITGMVAAAMQQVQNATTGIFGSTGFSEAQDAISLLLGDLAARGLDVSDFSARLATAMDLSDLRQRREALADLLGDINGRFAAIGAALGQYGDDINGAFAEFEDALRFLGLEGADAMREFVRLLREADVDFGDLGPLIARLESATPEEVAALVAEAFEAIRAGGFDLGGLTPGQVEDILARALGLAGTAGAGASGGPTQASVVRSITEPQGNRLLTYQAEQLRALRAIESSLSGVSPAAVGQSVLATGAVDPALLTAIRAQTAATHENTRALRDARGRGVTTRSLSRSLALDAAEPKARGNR